jgi:hypothetical protein
MWGWWFTPLRPTGDFEFLPVRSRIKKIGAEKYKKGYSNIPSYGETQAI